MLRLSSPLPAIQGLGSDRLRFLGVITGGHFAIHWFHQLFPMILPSIKAALGLNDAQVGALTSAKQLASGLLDLPAGLLADSLVHHRPIILASAVIFMGLGYLVFGWVDSFLWALLAAGLVGVGVALWHPAAAACLSGKFPERRATALSLHGMGATIADSLTPVVAGALFVAFSWQGVLKAQLLTAFIIGAAVWWALLGVLADSRPSSSHSAKFGDIMDLIKNPVFIRVSAANSLMQMGRLVVLTFLPIYLQEHLGYSKLELGVYITLLHGMGMVSQPVLGFLSDRFGRRTVLVPSFFTLGLLYTLLVVAAPGIQLGLVVTAIGLFFYTLLNVTYAAVMDVAGSKIQASSYGLSSLVTQLIVLPVPIAAGLLIEVYGIASAFLLSGGFLFFGALVLMGLRTP